MLRYTPAFLAAVQRRYEQTRQSERSIAGEFGLAGRTLRRLAARQGWVRPPALARDLEPAMRLLEQATALEQRLDRQRGRVTPPSDYEMPARIPVSRYTPDLLAVLRRRYEETPQSVRGIARDLDVSDRTLRRIAAERRWVRPPRPWRDLPRAQRLLEQANALERLYGRK